MEYKNAHILKISSQRVLASKFLKYEHDVVRFFHNYPIALLNAQVMTSGIFLQQNFRMARPGSL